MSKQSHIKLLDELSSNNEKLIMTATNFVQKKRTELMQQCYEKNNSNSSKFTKCADDIYSKTQKAL